MWGEALSLPKRLPIMDPCVHLHVVGPGNAKYTQLRPSWATGGAIVAQENNSAVQGSVESAVQSQYAKDLEKRGIMAVGGIAVPVELGKAMEPAIKHSGMTATTFIRVALAKAVNFEAQFMGPDFEINVSQFVPTPKVAAEKPLTQKARLAKAEQDAKDLAAKVAELEAALKAAMPPTPPTVMADPKTGELIEKA